MIWGDFYFCSCFPAAVTAWAPSFLIHDGCWWINQEKQKHHSTFALLFLIDNLLWNRKRRAQFIYIKKKHNASRHGGRKHMSCSVPPPPLHLFTRRWQTEITLISSSVCLQSQVLDNCLSDFPFLTVIKWLCLQAVLEMFDMFSFCPCQLIHWNTYIHTAYIYYYTGVLFFHPTTLTAETLIIIHLKRI